MPTRGHQIESRVRKGMRIGHRNREFEKEKKRKPTTQQAKVMMRVGFEPTRIAPPGYCIKVTLT